MSCEVVSDMKKDGVSAVFVTLRSDGIMLLTRGEDRVRRTSAASESRNGTRENEIGEPRDC